ncbi:MAPEG family protein [Novosphingobium piscinae]|uniref:MAPEG family protein n=1 Tax=Novosphingobium piscinae TaxID=1507448 RepID=A0A7X1FX69_9SPHN|nr:MAPEG family protein [Novosphingobium piscinae]MBC2668646.1 MAPEG family protein [Novosphingobium piscinae]
MILQTTLCLAAAAAVINFWLGLRIGQLRHALKVSVGDGGHEAILRRMRAQANFIENTPLLLILFGLVEATGKGGIWLAPLGAAFMLGRVVHAIGMDGKLTWGRAVGTLTAYLAALGLAVVAVLIALQVL